MFRRKSAALPADPAYPADLKTLGYKLNDKGQFVSTDGSGGSFKFWITDNDRANEVRKEAMHGT